MTTKSSKGWELEFDNKFKDSFSGGDMHSWERAIPIKEFIASLLQQQADDLLKQCRQIYIDGADWSEWGISDEEAGENFDGEIKVIQSSKNLK